MRRHGKLIQYPVDAIIRTLAEEIVEQLFFNRCMHIDGLGTFTAKLGVRKDKEMDNFGEGTTKRNALSIEVSGVSFRPDKDLIREIDLRCDLERGGEERLKSPKLTLKERIAKARQFLKKNGFMHVDEYASLTGLSYSTASRELLKIASDSTSGIISQGRKSGKLYLLANLS